MSVNIKENGNLTTVANNISITQANWNDRGNTNKNTCIKNQPATLKTLEEVSANTDENALVGANAVKELSDSLEWKHLGNIAEGSPIGLPSNYSEIYVIALSKDAYIRGSSIYNKLALEAGFTGFTLPCDDNKRVLFNILNNGQSIMVSSSTMDFSHVTIYYR